MSVINQALKKAQKVKESRNIEFSGMIASGERKGTIRLGNIILYPLFFIILMLFLFILYSSSLKSNNYEPAPVLEHAISQFGDENIMTPEMLYKKAKQYHSAKEEGVRICNTIYEDARTSGTWFVISAMGREAGHLAFGIGTSCHFPMIIIPEMFTNTKVTFDAIVKMVVSAMVKRQMMGIEYGVVIISEGVFHFMSDDEINNTGISFTYDEHGHPELGNVSKSHIFNVLVQRKLKELGISIKSRPEEMGYELRCVRPIAYDLLYSTLLGTGVLKLFKEGKSGCMVTMTQEGSITESMRTTR